MKNAVFWDVAPCRSCVTRRFGGTYRLHIQGRKIRERGTSESTGCFSTGDSVCSHLLSLVPRSRNFIPWRWRRYVPPKRRVTQDLHGATSQKTIFFNLGYYITINHLFKLFIQCSVSELYNVMMDPICTSNETINACILLGGGACKALTYNNGPQTFFLAPPLKCIHTYIHARHKLFYRHHHKRKWTGREAFFGIVTSESVLMYITFSIKFDPQFSPFPHKKIMLSPPVLTTETRSL
jgi:hypothetical protein